MGNDVEFFRDSEKSEKIGKLHFLRQQEPKENETHYYSLVDFLDPVEQDTNYIGAFAVTAGNEVDEWAKEFEAKNDDYMAIMIKAIGDRFAEATAEYLHQQIRTAQQPELMSLIFQMMI